MIIAHLQVGDTIFRKKNKKEFTVTKITNAYNATFITVEDVESDEKKTLTYGNKALLDIYDSKGSKI
jgi:glycyl-tRNA synthetase beta subunit